MISFCLLTPCLRIQRGMRAPSMLWNRNCWSPVGTWNRDEQGAPQSTAWILACTFQVKEQRCWAKVWRDKDRKNMAYNPKGFRLENFFLRMERVLTPERFHLKEGCFRSYIILLSSLFAHSMIVEHCNSDRGSGFKSREISLAFIHLNEIFLTQCRWGFL